MAHRVPPACPWWSLTGGGTCRSCRFHLLSPAPTPWWSQRCHAQAAEDPRQSGSQPQSHRPQQAIRPELGFLVGQVCPSCISFNQYLRVESLIFLSCVQIFPCWNGPVKMINVHPKCFVLFLQGQLGVSALPLGQRKGPGRGPASLLGHPLSPCPGSSGLVKNPGGWCLDTEDQVLQVKWWPPCPLKLSGTPGRGVGMGQHLYSHPAPSCCSAPFCGVTGGKFS